MACLTPAGAESSFVIAAACCQSGSIVRTLFKSKVNPDLVLSIILRKVQEAQSKHCPNLPWINLGLDLDWISRNHPTNHSTGAPNILLKIGNPFYFSTGFSCSGRPTWPRCFKWRRKFQVQVLV